MRELSGGLRRKTSFQGEHREESLVVDCQMCYHRSKCVLCLKRNSGYEYLMHSYIGPVWIIVTLEIPYLPDAPERWKSVL